MTTTTRSDGGGDYLSWHPHGDVTVMILRRILDSVTQLLTNLPINTATAREVLEWIFVPKVIFRQLTLLMALETATVTVSAVQTLIQEHVTERFSSRRRWIRTLRRRQRDEATSLEEWMDLAERVDAVCGHDVWRSDPDCPLYERSRITARVDEYVHLMRRRDVFELMYVLRGSVGRNKFGLLHEGLFSRALAGTKVLVETYHNVVCAALDFCCDAAVVVDDDNGDGENEDIPTEARLAFFNETRHAYGRTALLLSGGAALGFYHVGVVRALMTNRLLPRVLGGASAGSIVCAMLGTRTDQECLRDLFNVRGTDAPGHSGRLATDFFRPLEDRKQQQRQNQADDASSSDDAERRRQEQASYQRMGTFGRVYHNTAGAFRDVKRTLQGFVPIPLRRFSAVLYNVLAGNQRARDIFLNDTEHFRNCMRINCGDFTFQEAFDRTGRILNIVVTPQNASDPPRLLNYLTAPHVLVWSAAVASSSLPGVFEANRLVVKEADGWERYESAGDDQHFADGSLEQDLPMQQLSEMFNINHFIISQANPHAVMFASYNQKRSVWKHGISALMGALMTFLKEQVRSWLANLVECVGARRIAPFFETNRLIPTQFFTQEYEGRPSDISICPWSGHRGLFSALLHVIYNPSEAEFREWVNAAERETWQHIPAIKSHIAEEMTLDRCVQRLRRRLIQESWEKTRPQGQGTTTAAKTTSGRVPSFFTSASLTNLGGLNITDIPPPPPVQGSRVDGTPREGGDTATTRTTAHPTVIDTVDVNSGWGGMGLRGNRSSGNLHRSESDASGLFIDEAGAAAATTMTHAGQSAGERRPAFSSSPDALLPHGYIKTTSMAGFYYRKSLGSAGNLRTDEAAAASDRPRMRRQKSKSHADLVQS